MATEERSIRGECWTCIYRRAIPGDAHIGCMNPDPEMTGHPDGIRMGWFAYPINFDPVWKTRLCGNWADREQCVNCLGVVGVDIQRDEWIASDGICAPCMMALNGEPVE